MKLSTFNKIEQVAWIIWKIFFLIVGFYGIYYLYVLMTYGKPIVYKEIKTEVVKEVPIEVKVVQECDLECAGEIIGEKTTGLVDALYYAWGVVLTPGQENRILKIINCENLPYPEPKLTCEAEYK